jgi:ribosome-associated protein
MTDESDTFDAPSKSLRKRQSHELQTLGEELIQLPQADLDALPLPDTLREAVMLARTITKHGGLYRQKQFIGKLMRKIDAEPIRLALKARRDRDRIAARQFHLVERWRARLIDEAQALDEFAAAYQIDDRAQFAQLIEQARGERSHNRTPKAARELFRLIEKTVKPAGARES